jgi:uncharacterized protein (TIGR00159 family)
MYDILKDVIFSVTIYDVIDVAIISFIIYKLLQLMRGNRTVYVLVSVVGLLLMLMLAKYLGLRTVMWLLSNFTGYLVVLVAVIFQPEIRRILVSLGGATKLFSASTQHTNRMLEEIVRASTILANRQIGALIVIQRNIDLLPVVTVGQSLDSEVSKDLLISLFIPYSPLHDGAVIIKDSRISHAACILPLTKREDIPDNFGTRHRAAIGITEETDAIVVVVSEERGSISVVMGGDIATELDADTLHITLENFLSMDSS